LTLGTTVCALAALAVPMGPQTEYRWPLELPRTLTSSFAEYRPGRLHAGIDLRTNGEGRDVYAASDGRVSRLRCSPRGYGKAVYLELDDGHTVVYGHLSEFAPQLRDYVWDAQHRKRSYTVDLYPSRDAFPIKRGQIVGKSGQTGTGVPHLHFEIRDRAQRPVNPRHLGITWPDATPPILRRILVAPAEPAARVNGDIVPVVCDVRQTNSGAYACPPIRAAGRIGFGVDVIDPAEGGSKLGIYTLRAEADGREIFRVQNDRLSYEHMHNGAVAFHPFFLDEGRFLLLWRWPGNVTEVYGHTLSDGWFKMPAEPIDVRIEAADFLGNTASVAVPLIPERQTDPGAALGAVIEKSAVTLECFGEWLVITATFPKPEAGPPVLRINGEMQNGDAGFQQVDGQTFRAAYAPATAAQDIELAVVHERLEPYSERIAVFERGQRGRAAAFGGVSIEVKPDSPYGTLFARIRPLAGEPWSEIPSLGPAVEVWPEAAPIDAPVEIPFPAPEGVKDMRRVHVYRAEDAGWTCLDTARSATRLTISTRSFGTFAIMEDDQPPIITDVLPEDGAHTSRRPRIRAHVKDVGSGIEDIVVTCGGQWLLMEYDPERGLIEWARDEDLPSGAQTLEFRIADAAGNGSRAIREILVAK